MPFITLFSILLPILADFNASYPPNPLDTSSGTSPVFTEANSEAIHFLNLMDQYQYESAWSDGGPLMHDIISGQQWTAAMKTLRTPLGYVRTRQTASQEAVSSLPNGTRGNFVIIKYRTNFNQKNSVNETVVLMTIEYGKWRVISYTFR